ncbi:NPCBM/NEW2 domain-containing protein [Actinomadura graeca]|uniref:NPCBM/NEW2 domain-containing protein n=1 Tax=Actinomadura graeca TaxID=2750812 RepID=A0ABX8R439_9ACTN|nr:NPCBM/NEW2 domain-containing protein [Actinomadura graeca]
MATLIVVALVTAAVSAGPSSAGPSSAGPSSAGPSSAGPSSAGQGVPPRGTDPPATAEPPGSPPDRPAQKVYLTDLEPAEETPSLYHAWKNGPVTVDGQNYVHGMTVLSDCGKGDRQYALSRGYSRFRAAVGLADDTEDTSPVSFKITGDGKTIHSGTVQLRRPAHIDLDMRGLVRLGLETTRDECGTSTSVSVAIGEPQLEP